MSTFSFTNPGEIDIRGAYIAGLSAKEGDSPIGKFGTGLKYAVSCLLRWGGTVTIHSGLTAYEFTASALDFRGRSFDQIIMRERNTGSVTPLSFTTEYGHQWQPWQVFRELLANARDEGGDCHRGLLQPSPGQTTIHVHCDRLNQPFGERDTIILPRGFHVDRVVSTNEWIEGKGSVSTPYCSITNRTSPHLYYRNVRVSSTKPTALLYNFHRGLELTEDRTLADEWNVESYLRTALSKLTDEGMLWTALTSNDTLEADICGWPVWSDYTPEFLAVASRIYKLAPTSQHRFYQLLKRHLPEVTAKPALTPTRLQQMMLDRALKLVAQMKMDPTPYTIQLADLGNNILGEADRAKGIVSLSPAVFDKGTKAVLSTLFEELVHLSTGKDDCNYDMQTYLFDMIVSLHEEHVFSEPV